MRHLGWFALSLSACGLALSDAMPDHADPEPVPERFVELRAPDGGVSAGPAAGGSHDAVTFEDADGDGATFGLIGSRGVGMGGEGIAEALGALGTKGLGAGSSGFGSAGPVRKRPRVEGRGYGGPLPQTPLKAGSTDDNDDFDAFLSFLAPWSDRHDVVGRYQMLRVGGRAYVEVEDGEGHPLPGAEVSLWANDELVFEAATYGDGAAPIYPRLSADGTPRVMPDGGWTVRVQYAGREEVRTWRGEGDLSVALDVYPAAESAVPVDVAILLDTTGSMGDEIDRLKSTLITTTDRIAELEQQVDLRLGAMLYRDRGDAYVTREVPFTGSPAAFAGALRTVNAAGGGDGPEALNEGMTAMLSMQGWRPDAAKVVFLIADAAPHMDYVDDKPYGDSAIEAVGRGMRVHTVAASGLDPVGSLVFRQIAQLTQGEFIFIEYGTTAASAARHGVASPEQVRSNNLDQILFDKISDEVDGWRR